ncbi:PolC-type DNA polymerase III [Streptomyces sp. NBC_00094]|uniref:3'-5' exonuclease n=1 Tax=Streptomyces sp. NBC_00094 TaxID=2903620 RepID=UPI0022527DEB|nr:3'-5' exonuclease [Streptomyces sp. NBC_00094]MCX5395319.1 3'-5' exonuclease [Streptomyces sp. NBC_00094]
MKALMNDPHFAGTTLLVIDFEGLTPAGRPAEPVEVAVLALRPMGGRLVEVGRFEELMRPPADVPVTVMDVQLKGITQQMLSSAAPAAEVMARLEARLTAPPYRLVAHHASTEAGIIARQAKHCPVLAATPLLDTLRLAKAVVPGLGSYGLDSLLGYYGIAKPAGRHRAMPDVEVTAQVLARLLEEGCAGGRWRTLLELDAAAGLQPKRPPSGTEAEQSALF